MASVIPTSEFYQALNGIWRRWAGHQRKDGFPSRVALAVSGGPDSMALAHLCRKLTVEGYIPDLKVIALIVDHKSRKGSADEALRVAGWIQEMGLTPEILTLKWPAEAKDPSKLSNFETLARKLRYQALGTACTSANIQTLLLGHHRDDNIETGLLRLSQGHRRFGLAGFDCISPIPECHGLWGVSHSGDISSLETILTSRTPESKAKPSNLAEHLDITGVSPQLNIAHFTASGGVYLLRPFRAFPKARLEATCRNAMVPFVVDPTNADHTLTVRNTVRKLLASDDLPRALQSPPILALMDRTQRIKERLQELVDGLVKLIKVVNFDFRTGTLLLRLPSAKDLKGLESAYNDDSRGYPYVDSLEVRLKALRALIELVAAGSNVQISQDGLLRAAQMIWPESPEDTSSPDVFTLGGVQFQPQQRKEPWGKGSYLYNFKRRRQAARTPSFNIPDQGFTDETVTDNEANTTDTNIWLLSRESFRRSLPITTTDFGILLPDHISQLSADKTKSEWTEWKLWDGRYWVRLRATRQMKPINLRKGATPRTRIYSLGDTIPIKMRPLTHDDITRLRRAELKNRYYRRQYSWKLTDQDLRHSPWGNGAKFPWERKAFDILLACFAPGDIRTTIPALQHSDYKSAKPETICHPPETSATISKKEVAKTIAHFPNSNEVDGTKEDEEKYGNGQYEEDDYYDINDTEELVGIPTFNRRTSKKIWVRLPPETAQGLLKAATPSNTINVIAHGNEEKDSEVEFICPWIIEWEILYKHVDPMMIRNLSWE
ncbi:predicted protein [Uncinocarpus reesii 1704]|uniref:tRNA(Ile)-lysidine synthetase n=1 Tax=Uncinocarpus reesii (strain UAMH 1704) TaxID=336963 RepID=C4JS01_UNCRE|nr:uncharacterized protein UREG_05240 [Uncinocarpus reesii 1704]EEP80398.1 predicted protein [Uncinocarpus reesii 1704]